MINQGDIVIIRDDLSINYTHPGVNSKMLKIRGFATIVTSSWMHFDTNLFTVHGDGSTYSWTSWMCSHRTNGSNKLIKIRS